MAFEGFVARNMTFGAGTLFAVTIVLLLHANFQRYDVSQDAVTLRGHVAKLDRIVDQLKAELDGPSGCKAQVGESWSSCRILLRCTSEPSAVIGMTGQVCIVLG